MNSQTPRELTEEQKQYIEALATDTVNDMNDSSILVETIEEKIKDMEEHLKAYFHERMHFHHKNKFGK
ncbi:hypothetical protein NF212_21475 [Parasalinivibrio latis]|uniref:hypothetical protein n=1 Tax=Parasalinivibrio latis TaxID=2952610 RepID=UPI0030E534AD